MGMTTCCARSGTALPSFSSTGRLSAEAACTQRSTFSCGKLRISSMLRSFATTAASITDGWEM